MTHLKIRLILLSSNRFYLLNELKNCFYNLRISAGAVKLVLVFVDKQVSV